MQIFISQSGPRGPAFARAIQEFLRQIIPGAEPWVSDTGIEKGTRSRQEIATSLEKSEAGVICLTSDNLTAPWIHFEAGAVSNKPEGKVWTVLLDIPYKEVKPPLDQFQHTLCERDDFYKLIESVNAASPHRKIDADLRVLFDALWPTLEPKIADLRAQTPATPVPRRTEIDIQAEILETVRELKRFNDSGVAGTQMKTLRLVMRMYAVMVGEEPPLLKTLLDPEEEQRFLTRLQWFQVRDAVLGKRSGRNALAHGVGGNPYEGQTLAELIDRLRAEPAKGPDKQPDNEPDS